MIELNDFLEKRRHYLRLFSYLLTGYWSILNIPTYISRLKYSSQTPKSIKPCLKMLINLVKRYAEWILDEEK